MLEVTTRRKQRFLERLLTAADARLGFADVGSGGPLKRPWNLMPTQRFRKFEFEPTASSGSGLPLCVSNHVGRAPFHVARDERASSFHAPLAAFAE
ncbi:MAG TPA: hypothetical protein VFS58_12595, partial [Steroidobacteraceae bacterium]|nr:hypothetical protein [Steroidobacteraceae bacterium]